ncbi:hypothetical protein ACFLRN_02335 [Thermoproteota archaeon]
MKLKCAEDYRESIRTSLQNSNVILFNSTSRAYGQFINHSIKDYRITLFEDPTLKEVIIQKFICYFPSEFQTVRFFEALGIMPTLIL